MSESDGDAKCHKTGTRRHRSGAGEDDASDQEEEEDVSLQSPLGTGEVTPALLGKSPRLRSKTKRKLPFYSTFKGGGKKDKAKKGGDTSPGQNKPKSVDSAGDQEKNKSSFILSRIEKYESPNAKQEKGDITLKHPKSDKNTGKESGAPFDANSKTSTLKGKQRKLQHQETVESELGDESVKPHSEEVSNVKAKKHFFLTLLKENQQKEAKQTKPSLDISREKRSSFRYSRSGVRSSIRSSQKKGADHVVRAKVARVIPYDGTSSLESLAKSRSASASPVSQSDASGGGFPEYAKIIKRKSCEEGEEFQKSLLQSTAEKAPVLRRIEAANLKCRRELELSKKLISVKTSESFRKSRVTRRGSVTYGSRPKGLGKEDGQSFVKTQAGKIRRRESKNGRKNEYRVSVTIRPSTVATLTNKFNTIILENQNEVAFKNATFSIQPSNQKLKNGGSIKQSNKSMANTSKTNTSEDKTDERKVRETTKRFQQGRVNSRSPSPIKPTQKTVQLPSSLLQKFDDNKTDEEKVCEKIKMALASRSYKGETDDSDDESSEKINKSEKSLSCKCMPSDVVIKEPVNTFTSEIAHLNNDKISNQDTSLSASTNLSDAQNRLRNSFSSSSNQLNSKSIPDMTDDSHVWDLLSRSPQRVTESLDLLAEISEVLPSSDIHTKADSMDSGILSGDDRVSSPLSIDLRQLNASPDSVFEVANYSEKSELETSSERDDAASPNNESDLRSLSSKEDTTSEISSSSSHAKSSGKHGKGIYTSIKSAVKNTVKKTKERDAERKDDKEKRRKRSPSAERGKWFKRGRSKSRERQTETGNKEGESESNKNYEKWIFKKLREKSQERKQGKQKTEDEKENKKKSDKKERKNKKKEDNNYGLWSFRSRSRERGRLKSVCAEEESHTDSIASSFEAPLDHESTLEDLSLKEEWEGSSFSNETYGELFQNLLPPPPKTPIPAPPHEGLQNEVSLNTSKMESPKGETGSASSTENIYENLYSPDMEKLKRNREKIESRGIPPNHSFLWSKAMKAKTVATSKVQAQPPLDSERYGKIASRVCKDNEGHNYADLQHNSSGDSSRTMTYDEIAAAGYDDIRSPSSSGYDDIKSRSSTGYDTVKAPSDGYDPVNPPSATHFSGDGIVTAKPALVREDQIDSISYFYDDIASTYNASQTSHSYEPISPPSGAEITQAFCSIQELSEPSTPVDKLPPQEVKVCCTIADDSLECNSGSSGDGIHEVFSYKLTKLGKDSRGLTPRQHNSEAKHVVPPLSLHDASTPRCQEALSSPSLTPTERKSETSDDWVDVSDGETDSNSGIPFTVVTTQRPFARMRQPSKHGGRHRVWRRSWSQGVRDVAAAHALLSASEDDIVKYAWQEASPPWSPKGFGTSRMLRQTPSDTSTSSTSSFNSCSSSRTSYEDIQEDKQHSVYVTSSSTIFIGVEENIYDDAEDGPSYYNASSLSSASLSSSFYDSAKIRSIYYEGANCESQEITCFLEEGAESEVENDAGAHYEAIYEVISPEEEEEARRRGEQLADDEDDGDFDEDFDSDESGEAYSRLYLCEEGSEASQDHNMSGSSVSPKRREGLMPQYSQGITKIAETAYLGMRRLKKNLSVTKNEMKTGLSLLRKKGSVSSSDLFRNSEEILQAPLSAPVVDEKRKWSFKNHFRKRRSLQNLGDPPSSLRKDTSATFYLTLTIATDHSSREISISPSGSSNGICRRPSRPSSSCSGYSGRKQSTSSLISPVRPKTAPPAPPSNKSPKESDEESSKNAFANRLNELISTKPVPLPGRRVLRTSDCFGDTPVPILLPPDDDSTSKHRKSPSGIKYATINLQERDSEKRNFLSPDFERALFLSSPRCRTSVVSSSSSDGYGRSKEPKSPPPLPARPSSAHAVLECTENRLSSTPELLHFSPMFSESPSRNSPVLAFDEPLYASSHFPDEPLYQFYTATVRERAQQNQSEYSSEDDYEVINEGSSGKETAVTSKGSSPRLTAMEIVTPTDGHRTYWCELPEVVNSGILDKISSQQKKVEEAMFEVITSEASYLKSLNILVSHFYNCPEFSGVGDNSVLSSRDRQVLFSDVLPVKRCSELLLVDLEQRWQESYLISTISDIILKHAATNFKVYVKYCSKQIYQDRILNKLKENPRFVEVLTRLESSPICQSLAMQSFLMLPMQRITRFPLLMDAIYDRLDPASPSWHECKLALAALTKIVAECNEGARCMERMEEMLIISRQLDFREVKAIPLISASRWLVKKGEMTRLICRENDAKLTFGRRISKHVLYFFLFTDLLVVTKKKNEEQYMVLDYCLRNMVQVLELGSQDKFPGRILEGHKNLMIMTMLQNHEGKMVEMVLSCNLESDRARWIEAVTPQTSENPDVTIYEKWDCPQVQALYSYSARQPDELSLEVSDVVNVLKKMDGWYQGERLRDGEQGWFPQNHCKEIVSAHVRARNLRQRYRLLAISGSFLDELQREKEKFEKEERKREKRRILA